jgi:hypothetical protein
MPPLLSLLFLKCKYEYMLSGTAHMNVLLEIISKRVELKFLVLNV